MPVIKDSSWRRPLKPIYDIAIALQDVITSRYHYVHHEYMVASWVTLRGIAVG